MVLRGRAFKFGDDINTDFIISGRYKFSITDMKQLCRHLFEDIRPGFFDRIRPGKSMIVAGENFGMGSSREQAACVIKEAGISCVIAKSFARIFYRNAFNIGLALVEADTDNLSEGDDLEVNFIKGVITNVSRNTNVGFVPWNSFQMELIKSKGIIGYLQKHKTFKV